MTEVMTWNPKAETLGEYNRRKAEAEQARLAQRRTEALFRLGTSRIKWERYAACVEHYNERAVYVHAYIVCKDCYRLKPGLVEPRTSVMNNEFNKTLIPQNEDLAVGVDMLSAVHAMLAHEQEHHRPS